MNDLAVVWNVYYYPHMRAKFGRGPTVVSKKGSLNFNDRFYTCYRPKTLSHNLYTDLMMQYKMKHVFVLHPGDRYCVCRMLVTGLVFAEYRHTSIRLDETQRLYAPMHSDSAPMHSVFWHK